jgi:hypothetical protein
LAGETHVKNGLFVDYLEGNNDRILKLDPEGLVIPSAIVDNVSGSGTYSFVGNISGNVDIVFPEQGGQLALTTEVENVSASLTNKIEEVDVLKRTVEQVAHGFSVNDVLRFNGSVWTKGQADTPTNAHVLGVVESVADTDSFKLVIKGMLKGSGFTPGANYYLSPSTPGALVTPKPSYTQSEVATYVGVAVNSTDLFVDIGGFEGFEFARLDATGKLDPATLPTYIHIQNTPQSIWTINHNLYKYPSVTLEDTNGVFYGNIDYIDNTTLTVSFSVPVTGFGYIN